VTELSHVDRYATAISAARQRGDSTFQNWFDRAENAEAAVVQGYWDFAAHILTPTVVELLERRSDLHALEIGCGGGRLLNAACSYFQTVVGVDVHDDLDYVDAFLRGRGRTNFSLARTNGDALPTGNASVDFVYSFIVLQHLPTWANLVSYLEETYRCLKPGGVAQLYFGRLRPPRRPLRGYEEIDSAVNHLSLLVSPRRVQRTALSLGFRVVDAGVSDKTGPGGGRGRGAQGYVTLLKQA
jgi:SAM-dependent methyltransferase